jgi:hypothetical protein
MRLQLLTIVLAMVTAAAAAAEPFVEEIPADLPPAWQPASSEGDWHHGQQYLPGLGFEVTVQTQPRLLQRGFLDVLNRHNGNREVYGIAGWQDLGEVRVAGGKHAPAAPTAGSWCYQQFRGEDLTFTISRITPAILFETSASRVQLFAGAKRLGSGGPRTSAVSTVVPSHAAFVADGKVMLASTAQEISLAGMDEPWLLLWFGESSPYYRSAIPNLVWKMDPVKAFLLDGHFVPSDLPVLVVFQNRPDKLTAQADALSVSFGSAAGAFQMLPLLGFRHPSVAETAGWTSGLPPEIAASCRSWSRRLQAYPLSCTESRRIGEEGREVTIRQSYTYRELPDAWQTPCERMAPLPPVVAMVSQSGFPVSFSAPLLPHAIATHSGPYTGVAGDAVEFTITGLDKYVNEAPDRRQPAGPDADWLLAEVRHESDKIVAAGPLAPAALYAKRHWQDYLQAEPGLTTLALAEILPYLDQPARDTVVDYAFAQLQRQNPLTTTSVPTFQGARREYYPVAPLDVQRRHAGQNAARDASVPINPQQRADSVYAIWAWGRASGRWQAVQAFWPQAKAAALAGERDVEWATCGYVRGPNETRGGAVPYPGEDRGSTAAVNGRFGRWVGLARLARVFGDRQTEQAAMYRLARTALLRCAQGRLIDYQYDAKIQVIDAEPDWMLRLSTATGNGGGQGLLWSERWVDAAGDLRCVVRWDEHGPVISQAFGDHWMPVIPKFLNLTPECGRFLHDHLPDNVQRFVDGMEHNAQAWFVVGRPANIGKETAMDDPRNSYGTFLGIAYALQADGDRLMRYQDIPYYRTGDMYQLRRLAATLWALNGSQWQRLER